MNSLSLSQRFGQILSERKQKIDKINQQLQAEAARQAAEREKSVTEAIETLMTNINKADIRYNVRLPIARSVETLSKINDLRNLYDSVLKSAALRLIEWGYEKNLELESSSNYDDSGYYTTEIFFVLTR